MSCNRTTLRPTLVYALLCSALALATSNAMAQNADTAAAGAAAAPSNNVSQLGNIVVTASGFEQDIADAPASISVITREDLESKFYRDVHDALQDAPGVITTGGGDRLDISLRGMSSQYTLILIDGKRQSSRETRTNSDSGGVEGGWTPPISAIERIEIVRGPMSSLYGSDAMGGVINIITRKVPEAWHGELRYDATLQKNDDSGDIHQANFYLGGPLKSELLGLAVYGQYSYRDEDNIYNGFRKRRATNINAKLSLTPNRNHDIILDLGSQRQRYNNTLGKTVAPQAPPCGRNGCPTSSETDYLNTTAGLSHTGRWGFGVTDTWVKHEEFDNKSREMKIRNTDVQSTLTAPLGESHILTAGAAYQYADLNDKTGNQLNTGISDISRYQWSLFAEDEWRVIDSLALTGGLRMDKDENFGTHFSPRLYAVYHPAESWTVKGGVSTGFRAPSLRQTVRGWGQVSRGGNMYGNPDLKPEKSVNYEIGTHYEFAAGGHAGLTLFYNDFKDKITRVACPQTTCTDGPNQFGSDPTTYVNVDKAATRGVETSFKFHLDQAWSLAANYTYTHSEQKSGQYEGQPLNQLPKHVAHVTLDYKPTDTWNAWTRVNFRGRESQPITGPSTDSLRAPSYTLLDLGGTYNVSRMVTLYAGIYNVFDKHFDYEDYGYIEDGRRYWLGASVKF